MDLLLANKGADEAIINGNNEAEEIPASKTNLNDEKQLLEGDDRRRWEHVAEEGGDHEEIKISDADSRVPDNSDDDDDKIQMRCHVSKKEDVAVTNENKIGGTSLKMIQPHSQLPKPEAPNNNNTNALTRSKSLPDNSTLDMPSSIGKFFKEIRSSSVSASIVSRLSSLNFKNNPRDGSDGDGDGDEMNKNTGATEFSISGLKVVVRLKSEEESINASSKGRISFFSRSNCRDCTAVRSFFRDKGLKFVEINIDVFPLREKELIERTGNAQVPQIFFNDKLLGCLVALNSLRNSGCFEQKLKEMLVSKSCGGDGDAPAIPVYGFDDPDDEDEAKDEMVGIVRLLRQRLPIQDRLMRMKIVKNCFSGSQMVELLIHHLDCGRKKAVGIGKQLAKKHFIHHVFGENDFEDGNHFYRFLEHQPFISKCYNFRGSTNDREPKSAIKVGLRLNKLMSAILESYASDDRSHVDYARISISEEFRRYINLVENLHRLDILELSTNEKLAFFLNLHNAMVIHAVIRVGCPEGVVDRRSFYSDFQYIVGGFPYSLNAIKNGILRNNRRSPYSLVKPFGAGDKRLEIALEKVNPLIHFGLCNGTRSSPTVRLFTPQGVEAELKYATREFFQRNGMEVDLEKRTVHLTRIIKWFNMDFGQEKEILRWIINYLDATKAGLLTHLLGDGGPINIMYQNYDWSVNS